MLIKLQPEQVSTMWDAIKFSALEANNVGEYNSACFMNNLLERLLAGSAQAWMCVEDTETERVIHAVIITCLMEDPILGNKYILVHTMYGFKQLSLALVRDSFETLSQFARDCECTRIVAMTQDQRILKLHQHVGMQQEFYISSKTL